MLWTSIVSLSIKEIKLNLLPSLDYYRYFVNWVQKKNSIQMRNGKLQVRTQKGMFDFYLQLPVILQWTISIVIITQFLKLEQQNKGQIFHVYHDSDFISWSQLLYKSWATKILSIAENIQKAWKLSTHFQGHLKLKKNQPNKFFSYQFWQKRYLSKNNEIHMIRISIVKSIWLFIFFGKI